ncbi:uncharacterized protein LOC116424956 isoform X2 [Nomia melanderi]|uniref:uncharacterized protein LOC116424956 isoform X2 n=1 Tax=Nomia melanderi TaxID=2448451 RepID=UPI0013047736|nr:WD repeat-containing protein DDB_G0292056-like isoform X2 [Nomia melanderi]
MLFEFCFIIILIPSATMEEGCRDDFDCTKEQYCYGVSKQCVNYTVCKRYNRQEGRKPSRHSSQCGPCLPNYVSEELGTGEPAALCRKANENIPEIGRFNQTWIIITVVGSILLLVIIGVIIFKTRKKRKKNNLEVCSDICAMEPSAPPPEFSPFIDHKKGVSYVLSNNNKNLKDKNKLVSATAYNQPNWVKSNPNYEYNLNNNHDEVNVLEQLHSTFETPPANNNPSTWTPEQLTQEVVIRNVSEYGIEQMDNSTNAAIIERNNSSSSNTAGDDNTNNNNNSTNSNASASSSNNTQDGTERTRASNILIAHVNVNLNNVNVRNRDC